MGGDLAGHDAGVDGGEFVLEPRALGVAGDSIGEVFVSTDGESGVLQYS